VRFVADESCDFAVVRALRSAGHDVLAVAEISPRMGDDEVLKHARDDRRILLSEDTDFGELVYAEGLRSSGVILFRFPATARGLMAAAAIDTVNQVGDELSSRFTVVLPGASEQAAASLNGRSLHTVFSA
jgi:predicted nuclease of predicted toxin-antitoxin system